MNCDHQHLLDISYTITRSLPAQQKKNTHYCSFERQSNNVDDLILTFFPDSISNFCKILAPQISTRIVARRKLEFTEIIVSKNKSYSQETHFSFGNIALNQIMVTFWPILQKKAANFLPIWYSNDIPSLVRRFKNIMANWVV